MTLDDAIAAAVTGAVAPLVAEIRALRSQLNEMRAALPPTLVSQAEAARRLGVTCQTIANRRRAGEIRAVQVGRRVLIDLASVRPVTDDQVAEAARIARGR